MAGIYPDVPGPRMAYDRDGTAGFHINAAGVVLQLPQADLHALNDEDSSSASSSAPSADFFTVWWGLVFPEPRDLVGVALDGLIGGGGNFAFGPFQTSPDTTNGLDGTWTDRIASPAKVDTKVKMRDSIVPLSVAGVKGVRVRSDRTGGAASVSSSLYTMHLYGTPSAAGPRLQFWHPTVATEVGGAYFDWGDTPRNAITTRTFRVHNPGTQTANDVTLTTEALTDTTPTNVSQHTFSLDGSTFTPSLSIGNLAPGATSPVITVRRQVPADAALSLWWARIVASAASYT